MKRVIIESPYAGDVKINVAYAHACLKHSLERDEAPIASHLLYPQVLDDKKDDERRLGIEAGLAWTSVADIMAFYIDLGMSKGMLNALKYAVTYRIPYEIRMLPAGTILVDVGELA